MGKSFFFMTSAPKPEPTRRILPDVYCPVGGYHDKNLDQTFSSKGDKARFLRSKGMKEAEPFNPNKMLGGTEGRANKVRGSRGNFQAKPMPGWMKQELSKHVR